MKRAVSALAHIALGFLGGYAVRHLAIADQGEVPAPPQWEYRTFSFMDCNKRSSQRDSGERPFLSMDLRGADGRPVLALAADDAVLNGLARQGWELVGIEPGYMYGSGTGMEWNGRYIFRHAK